MASNLKKLAMCAVVAFGGVAMAQEAEPSAAPAQEPVKAPSADAVKTTWEYFYKGQGQGPVLVDAKLCTEVAKDGPNKFECTVEANPDSIKAGTSIMLWQSYLVPQGDSIEDLMVQVKQGTVVRETKDVKIKGEGWRSRQWTGVRMNKPGEWTVSILRGDQELKSIKVKVL
ncbi:hypothetical protein [Archangium lansingense]|uniref:DUF2914 domain-containing protein n=1 Tax=Archangium lansingense TaxID=2995310 RepID=A0ABT3ZWW9_9BACT|nr:hypothetical protein [Archangium lansinium]MCY1073888.1 hypothetical protein [Archangium lansinium]